MTSLSLTGLGMKNSFISISDMDDRIKMEKETLAWNVIGIEKWM